MSVRAILFACALAALSTAWSQGPPLPRHAVVRAVLQDLRTFREEERRRDSAAGHPLGSFREEDFLRRYRVHARADSLLLRVDSAGLPMDDRINLSLLRYSLEDELSDYRYKWYLNPLLSDGGFHTRLTGMAGQSPNTPAGFEAYLLRLRDIPRYVEEHLVLMRRGLAIGMCQPRDIFKGYESTYEQHIVQDPTASIYWKPFKARPAAIPEGEWARLTERGREAIRDAVVPAYMRIRAFFAEEYLPRTRTSAGALHLPDGEAYYRERILHYTTTGMSADEIYRTGLQEVERIEAEMAAVLKEVGYTEGLAAFIGGLRTDPRFLPQTAEQLLKEASYIAKKADGKLPLLFGRLPRQPYGVEPVPADLAPVYTGGRYAPAPIEGRRAGNYWVNTYNLGSRPMYTLEALTLHEAVPGHHLQMSLTQELEGLPAFRRNLYVNAFGEGWGLYAERLGYEMGFYADPYSRFGQLTYDMWRACRLVIDVGLHAKGWTRDQAVQYLSSRTALSLHEVNTEVNRYMAWPGQALAYKIGELRIRALREKAEKALGTRFDIRSFHDMLLSEGTVTMEILGWMVDGYIRKLQARP